MFKFMRVGIDVIENIKELFLSVFTVEPWNDDWSDEEQLDLYLYDLVGQNNSLTYGLYEDDKLIGISMGHIKHWCTGTEYYIEEFYIQPEKQGKGAGTFFINEIQKDIKKDGIVQIFLQTESNVPAYVFYRKNGFNELKEHVSFVKKI